MNTTENNKSIAEFLGWTLDDEELNTFRKRVNGIYRYANFKFQTDWNDLMEVVEKIETIEEQRFLFQISTRQGFYAEVRERFSYETKIEDAWGETRIEAVYDACVEFIKWYNEQKQ